MVHLLERASRASAQELHKTLIRNEAAYFGCVKQLVLQHPPPPQPQAAGALPLYLCGDSHCLSGVLTHLETMHVDSCQCSCAFWFYLLAAVLPISLVTGFSVSNILCPMCLSDSAMVLL